MQPAPTAAVSREERLAIVSLTRPPDNRIDEELAVWLWECLDGLDHDPDVGAIVLTGTGEMFCAGASLFYRSREQTFEEALGEARRALARAFGAD